MTKEQFQMCVEEVLAASLAEKSDTELTKLGIQFDEIEPKRHRRITDLGATQGRACAMNAKQVACWKWTTLDGGDIGPTHILYATTADEIDVLLPALDYPTANAKAHAALNAL